MAMLVRRGKQRPIDNLYATFQQYLYLPEPYGLYSSLACYVANLLPGNPVWLLHVSPPATGGSTLINVLDDLPGIVQVGDISVGGLVSAVSKKDRKKESTGGLLFELPCREDGKRWGIIKAKDFTSVLAKERTARAELLSALKEIYDGNWHRNKGTDGGMHAEWHGKVGFIAKCTEMIDNQENRAAMSQMGDRFIYFRYKQTDGIAESAVAAKVIDEAFMRTHLQYETHEFLNAILPPDWFELVKNNQYLLSSKTIESLINQKVVDRVSRMARFACAGRGYIKRDDRTREMERSEIQGPGRVIGQLKALYLAGVMLGLNHFEIWDMLDRIAWSCLPKNRAAILHSIIDLSKGDRHATGYEFKEIMQVVNSNYVGVGEKTHMERILHELIVFKLVEEHTQKLPDKGTRKVYRLSKYTKQLLGH